MYSPEDVDREREAREGEERYRPAYEGGEIQDRLMGISERRELKEGDLEEIQREVENGLFFMMSGLRKRKEYELSPEKNPNLDWELIPLKNLFLDLTTNVDRPQTRIPAAVEAVTEGLADKIRRDEVKMVPDEGGETPDPKEIEGRLEKLAVWADIVHKMDLRAQQRAVSGDDMGTLVNMVLRKKDFHTYQTTVFPTGPEWWGAFNGFYSEEISKTLTKIKDLGKNGVDYGEGNHLDRPYADNKEFERDQVFSTWLKEVYEAAGEDMFITLLSWRLAQILGVTARYATKDKKEKEKQAIYDQSGNPKKSRSGEIIKREVITHNRSGNSLLLTNTEIWSHYTAYRAIEESGLAKDSETKQWVRIKPERFVSHGGLTVKALQEIGDPILNPFLDFIKLKTEDEEEISLWELWDEYGVEPKDWPFRDGEEKELEIGEEFEGPIGFKDAAAYGFMWNRANAIIGKLIRGSPSVDQLFDPGWWQESQWRHAAKLIGKDPAKEDFSPEKSPEAQLLLAYLKVRAPSKKYPEGAPFHHVTFTERWEDRNPEESKNTLWHILIHPYNLGLIGREEWRYIEEQLGVRHRSPDTMQKGTFIF